MVKEKIIEYVVHAKLDPTKKYLCLVDPMFILSDSLDILIKGDIIKRILERNNIVVLKVKDIDKALKFIELPENVIGIATEKEVMP